MIDDGEKKSLYFLGLMNLLGYGRDQDIEQAVSFFKRSELEKDPRALNALGYIYFSAPKTFEQDPVKLNQFGKLRQDLKQAYIYFKKAVQYGSINAKFNIGSLYLSGETFALPKSEDKATLDFSFSKAYDWFK